MCLGSIFGNACIKNGCPKQKYLTRSLPYSNTKFTKMLTDEVISLFWFVTNTWKWPKAAPKYINKFFDRLPLMWWGQLCNLKEFTG